MLGKFPLLSVLLFGKPANFLLSGFIGLKAIVGLPSWAGNQAWSAPDKHIWTLSSDLTGFFRDPAHGCQAVIAV